MDPTQLVAYLKGLLEALGRIDSTLWPFAHPDQVVAMLLKDSLGLLLKVWFGFILRTTDFETGRDFTSNITIHRFEPAVQVAADAALVLVVIWSSYRIMWGSGVRTQYSARILLPRLLMGTVLINFPLPLIQVAVQATNAMCDAIQSFGTIPDWHTWWSNYALDQTHGVWQVVTTGDTGAMRSDARSAVDTIVSRVTEPSAPRPGTDGCIRRRPRHCPILEVAYRAR